MNLFAAFGLVIGFSLAYLFRMGFFGGLFFSLMISGLIKSLFNSSRPQQNSSYSNSKNHLFLVTTFEVLGNISKSKGVITPLDIQSANQLMKELGINGASQKLAQEAFRRGKESHYPLEQRVTLLKKAYLLRPDFLDLFLEFQIRHVLIDGAINSNERKKLETIAAILGVSPIQFSALLSGYGFEANQQDSFKHSYYERSYEQGRTTTSAVNKAYNLLKVKPDDSAVTIKRAYRRLMSQYHPDKIMANGASAKELDMANKKAQEIQAAYQVIKKTHKGL